MSVNSMTFEQSAAFLTDLYKEATGQYPAIQITNTQDFTTVGTTLIQGGYDPIISAISQVLQKTIYYSNKLYKLLLEYTDKIERFSIDECFLDMTNSLMGRDILDIAYEINKRVKDTLLALTDSIKSVDINLKNHRL